MKKMSLWLDNAKVNGIKKLDKDLNLDVLIIGGGITGLSTLYYLRNSDLKVALVEQDLVGHGVSGKTTGKINYLQEVIYSDLTKSYSLGVAKTYLDSQLSSIEDLKNIIKKENIDCNLMKVKSYVYSDKKKEVEKIICEKKILEKLGVKVNEHLYKNKNVYAISVDNTYVFNAVKYIMSLKNICISSDKEIYERTKIYNIKKSSYGYICKTKDYKIRAKKIVLACHYPYFLLPYLMPLKVYTEKSYITASKAKYLDKTFITSSLPCTSIRYHKNKEDEYMIYLSNSSNICCNLNEKKNFESVIKDAVKLGLKPEYIWKNDDLITVDKLPYIGRIEKNNDTLLIGTGYNTWGMTNGALAGKILSDIVLGNKNIYEGLVNPLRSVGLSNIIGYLTNIGSSIKGYIPTKIFKNKKWYNNNVKIVNKNGKSIAIYEDENGKHFVYNKCPHMGCSLIFNEVEKTWDCPCHASRFDIDGKCIKGPSRFDIGYKGKEL